MRLYEITPTDVSAVVAAPVAVGEDVRATGG
jgi:hypothetical protein